MEITFANLICGYLDANALFVPLTNNELANGKEDLPKDVRLVVRGDVKHGPHDYYMDGITDSNSDGRADDGLDATLSQYLVPDASLLLNNVHYYARQASTMIGGATTSITSPSGAPVSNPQVSVITSPPGSPEVEGSKPDYWYLVVQPIGGSDSLLTPGTILEIGVNPRMPYEVRYVQA